MFLRGFLVDMRGSIKNFWSCFKNGVFWGIFRFFLVFFGFFMDGRACKSSFISFYDSKKNFFIFSFGFFFSTNNGSIIMLILLAFVI